MLEFLGVTSNFPSIANQANTLRWEFTHNNGTPVNLDGTAITGYALAAGKSYPIAIASSPLPNEAHILHVSIPPLPEGRWQYETHAQSQDGESQRLISGYISVLKNLQPEASEEPTRAERTLLISLPEDAAETLHLRWLANTAAQAAASSANSSAQHANTKAEAANNSAATANTSAQQAASSAASAESSANNASNSASKATQSATTAKTSETKAANSATQASNSSTAAKTSETNASNSAKLASEKANTASNAATAAKTSETNATQSASHASTSATNAATSANQAANSANSIGEAETNSSASATDAAKSATEAKTSAQNSEASASTANSKATQATNAATDAANSATAAKASQTTAQTAATQAISKAAEAAQSALRANADKDQAGIKANEAAASASQAAASATNIGNAESNTAASATAAKASETKAAASSTQASTSAINAKTSETNAEASATNASNSASSATAKATEAASSASTAQTAINSIGNSLSQAASSASQAAASASTADSSAKSAAASQTAANNSATNAATSANQAAASALGASNTLNTLNNQKGQASGLATLDASSRVPASQLPSYVDDVLEYPTQTNFPTAGETGKLYVTTDNNKLYRWTGSTYIEITSAPIIIENSLDSISSTDALSAQMGWQLNREKLDNSHNTSSAAHQDIREQLTGIARLENLNQWTGHNIFPADSVTIDGKYPVLKGENIEKITLKFTDPDGWPRTTSIYQEGSNGDLCFKNNEDGINKSLYFASIVDGELNLPNGEYTQNYGEATLKSTEGKLYLSTRPVYNQPPSVEEIALKKDLKTTSPIKTFHYEGGYGDYINLSKLVDVYYPGNVNSGATMTISIPSLSEVPAPENQQMNIYDFEIILCDGDIDSITQWQVSNPDTTDTKSTRLIWVGTSSPNTAPPFPRGYIHTIKGRFFRTSAFDYYRDNTIILQLVSSAKITN